MAKTKAKKWTTMSQVLQDVAGMAIDFERSHGYSLPTFEVKYVSSTNSSSSYRSNRLTTKSIQQSSTDRINQNVGIARDNTTKRTVQQPPSQVPPQNTNPPRKSSVT